jgi:hypothetical protein
VGKWSHLDGKVPDLPQDPDRKDAFFAEVDKLKGKSTAYIAGVLDEAKERKTELEKSVKKANFAIDVADYAMRQAMQAEGLKSVVIGGFRYTPSPEPYANVTDRQAFLAWAMQNMKDNLNINWNVLQATVKAALDTGDEFPPGVDVHLKKTISRRKQSDG